MKYKLSDICSIITDYVANGSFKALKENVTYNSKKDYARLIRFVDYSRNFSEEGAVYVSEHSYNFLKKSKLFGGELILANVGTIGEPFLCPLLSIPMTLGPNVVMLKTNDNICDQKYLFYYFMSRNGKHLLDSITSSSAVPKFNKTDLRNQEIDLPDLETQQKIVRILSALDQKIELNNSLIDSLYSLGDAFYEKIQNDNPRTVTLKDISINYDKRRVPLSSRQREERRGKFPYYGATSILDYVDDYLFDGEYVLLGEDGTVMTNEGGAVLQYIWGKNWVNNHAHVLQGSEVSTEYLLFALRSVNVSALVTGAVQPKINQENMNKIKLSIGSKDKMSEVEESIKTIAAQIRNLTNENKSLSDMRDILLPKLMSGGVKLDRVTL